MWPELSTTWSCRDCFCFFSQKGALLRLAVVGRGVSRAGCKRLSAHFAFPAGCSSVELITPTVELRWPEMPAHSLAMSSSALPAFLLCSTLLVIKMYVVAIITGQVRLRKKVRAALGAPAQVVLVFLDALPGKPRDWKHGQGVCRAWSWAPLLAPWVPPCQPRGSARPAPSPLWLKSTYLLICRATRLSSWHGESWLVSLREAGSGGWSVGA